jgi:hypothetical protein
VTCSESVVKNPDRKGYMGIVADCTHHQIYLYVVDPGTWLVQCMQWECLSAWPIEEAPIAVLQRLAVGLDDAVRERTASAN